MEGDLPAEILAKLSRLVLVARPDQFATVACGIIDTERRELTVASAGHLDFLLIDAAGARFVETPVGTPVGVASGHTYESKTIGLPRDGTILGFTDGLVERRGESLDVGLLRFQSHVASPTEPLEALVSRLVDELAPGGSDDDIALLGIRWSSRTPRRRPRTSGTLESAGRGASGWVSPPHSRERINRVSQRSWWSVRSTLRARLRSPTGSRS